MSKNRRHAARELAGHALQLLDAEHDPAEQATIEDLQARAADWAGDGGEHPDESTLAEALDAHASDTRHATLEHLLGCRDCRFAAAILLADRGDRQTRGTSVDAGRPWLPRLAAAVAAMALVASIGWLGFWIAGQPERAPLAAAEFTSVELTTSRGTTDTAIQVRLSEIDAGLVLQVETRLTGDRADWALQTGEAGRATTVLAGGTELDPDASPLRRLEVLVPRQVLRPASHTLVVRSADGAIERRWRFSVRP